MQKKYDTICYIGRFQPTHIAHTKIITRAATLANQVIVVIGSADAPRTYKNPFSVAERKQMLREAATDATNSVTPTYIESVRDSMYNNQAWATRVQEIVAKRTNLGDKIAIIGHSKDESSFYLKLFPQWAHEEVELIEPLNATDIRDLYFRNGANPRYLIDVVPQPVFRFLNEFRETEEFAQIVREREFIAKYKKQFEGLQYAPVFVTADAVVICSGHVLMVKRKAEPGKGLFALPGGFLNAATDASMQSAAIRELREETGIKVPVPVLVGSIKNQRVFDAINRSARGRTITHAFVFVLPDGDLPKVKGADDAEKAMWVPFADVRSDQCFDDHYDIIQWAVGG
jgi:bifunctional NMN adenylyltransferase/nudix hydrolase